jgi:putative transposase
MSKTMLIEPHHQDLSIARQCDLIGLNRSSYYYHLAGESDINLAYMRVIDEQYMRTPFFGSRMMSDWMNRQGYGVNRKRVQRLMRKMGIQGSVPGPHTSKAHPQNKIYPYLLRNLDLRYANLVWSTDFTYVPLRQGFMYLVAVIDWYSRYVLSWELSNTMDHLFCISATVCSGAWRTWYFQYRPGKPIYLC